MQRPRALPHPRRPLGQAHPLVAPEGARAPDGRPARHALGGPAGQPRALPRVPAARRAQVALPPRRAAPGPRAPRRLARIGIALPAPPVRPPRAHTARAPRRDPRRDPARTLQRPPRAPELQDPPDQPPQLPLPLSRRPDRARLPLLHRHRHRPAAMNFTHNSTGAPKERNVLDHLPERDRPAVKRRLRHAWAETDHHRALERLRLLAAELERSHPGAAASLREGLEETLTLTRLGIKGNLKRTLESTNPCESMIECVRRSARNVKRWQSGDMALRWTAAGMLEAERQFRRIIGYAELAKLVTAIEHELTHTATPTPTKEAPIPLTV